MSIIETFDLAKCVNGRVFNVTATRLVPIFFLARENFNFISLSLRTILAELSPLAQAPRQGQ